MRPSTVPRPWFPHLGNAAGRVWLSCPSPKVSWGDPGPLKISMTKCKESGVRYLCRGLTWGRSRTLQTPSVQSFPTRLWGWTRWGQSFHTRQAVTSTSRSPPQSRSCRKTGALGVPSQTPAPIQASSGTSSPPQRWKCVGWRPLLDPKPKASNLGTS